MPINSSAVGFGALGSVLDVYVTCAWVPRQAKL